MESHVKVFPADNATIKLTINYPDSLIACYDNPRDWYTEDALEQSEETMARYPDMILIPLTGSYIKKVHVWRKIKETKIENGQEIPGEEKIEEYDEDQGQHWWNFWVDTFRHKRPKCKKCCFYRIGNGLGEISYRNKHHEANWTRTDVEYIYTIDGECDYFHADTGFFFAYHNDTMGKDYAEFMDYFPGKRMISYMTVFKDANRIDLCRFSLKERVQRKCADGEFSYSPCKERQCKIVDGKYEPFDNIGEILPPEACRCDGLHFSMFLQRPLPDGSGTYDLKGTTIQIVANAGPLVSIQADYKNGDKNVVLMGTTGSGKDTQIQFRDAAINGHEIAFVACPEALKYDKYNATPSNVYITNPFNLYAMTKNTDGKIPQIFKSNTQVAFSNLYVAKKENGELFEKLIWTDVPKCEWGINIFPVFKSPQVRFVKLNCDRGADENNVVGNNDAAYFVKMMEQIKAKYGEWGDYSFKNVDNWTNTTVEKELALLKNSSAKFKILYINCHGFKYPGSDKSGGVLHEEGNNWTEINFEKLDAILRDKKPDEYYFIFAACCYGGGLFEDTVHNDIFNQNYSVTTGTDNWNNVYLLFCDCANSPAWADGAPGRSIGQLFNPASPTSYAEYANRINSVVTTNRQNIMNLISQFIQNNYGIMREIFDMSKFNWTDDTYQKSLQFTNNIIVQYSKLHFDNEKENLFKTYPAAFLFHVIEKLGTKRINNRNMVNWIPTDNPPISRRDFLSRPSYYLSLGKKLLTDMNQYLVSDANFYLDGHNAPQIRTDQQKATFQKYVTFVYQLYSLLCSIYQQAKNIWNLRELGMLEGRDQAGCLISYYIDDVPGAINKLDEQCGRMTFPNFPGYVSMATNLNDENTWLEKYIYTAPD